MNFEGQEVFKNAVKGMSDAIDNVLSKEDIQVSDIDLFIPHQANMRIIQSLAKRLNFPIEKVIVRIDEYANTSAASIPLAMVDALNDKRIKPGMNILVATFGAGLTCGAGIIKWGDRVESISESSKSIPDYNGSIFDLMKDSFNHYGINASHLLTP